MCSSRNEIPATDDLIAQNRDNDTNLRGIWRYDYYNSLEGIHILQRSICQCISLSIKLELFKTTYFILKIYPPDMIPQVWRKIELSSLRVTLASSLEHYEISYRFMGSLR
jgi:hypothetical protein